MLCCDCDQVHTLKEPCTCLCLRLHALLGEHMHLNMRRCINVCVTVQIFKHIVTCCSVCACMRAYASARVHRPHKMSLMLTWLWRPGLEGTKGRGILQPYPTPAPFFPLSGPDTNKRIRSPCFRQTLYSRQSSDQLSVTLNDKSANLCQSLWAGIPVFGG